MHCNLLS